MCIGHDRLVSAAPVGSILDVEGIGVGHHQRTGKGWQTGTTVVSCRGGAVPGVDVRGGGPGTRETDALQPENLVQEVHAICLTGGSAFGLSAADGVVAELESLGLGFPIADGVVPVVPSAVIFDLARGGVFTNRPDASFGQRAARAALGRRAGSKWGAVGAGTGARAGGLQGGVGTASRNITIPGRSGVSSIVPGANTEAEADVEVTVGALAVVNSNGRVIDETTGRPWEVGGHRLARPTAAQRAAVAAAMNQPAPTSLNTTIGVVAVSAALSKAESSKMASVAHDGLARAIRPAHSMTDGDTIFALATGGIALGEHPQRILGLNLIFEAAAEAFASACTHAVLAARSIGDSPAWTDLVS